MRVVFMANTMESLGIEYLSAYLKRAGHHVSLVFDPLLFRDYFTASRKLSKLCDMRDVVIEKAVNLKPDVILFSVLSGTYRWSLQLAGDLKIKTGATIIFGGMHPTAVPEIVIQEPAVDFVGVGECEEALVELLGCLSSGKDPSQVRNFWMKKDGRVVRNPLRPLVDDLDELLPPDKDIFYGVHPALVDQNYTIATSRGCAYQCSFCYNSFLKTLYPNGKYYRKRSNGNVIAELKRAKEKYAIKSVYFVDDILTQEKGRLREFIKSYRDEINLPFRCEVMPGTVDDEVAALLSSAGCTTVNMGVQTLSPVLRRTILNRHDTNDDIVRAIDALRGHRISIHANIILGLPGQDEKEWLDIARFFNRHRLDAVLVFWLIYYPRTAIIKKAIECGALSQEDALRLEREPLEVNTFSESKDFVDKRKVKFANLISCSVWLPAGVFDFIVRRKIFCYIPDFVVSIINICTMGVAPALKALLSVKAGRSPRIKLGAIGLTIYHMKELFLTRFTNQAQRQAAQNRR
ncbi:MAG: radical SAM protein [Candidatus Omnitrophica bacterium]|nr:radical SAM protein [Candidatus Omnitrophota bacterium]